MSNTLKTDEKAQVVGMLCEGNSIRSIERMTGIHRDTIMRLGVRMGEGCQRIMDEKLRNLNCARIEVDEVWGFIGMKQKTARRTHQIGKSVGDIWTWVAIDPDTKLVPAFAVGDRNQYMANCFIEDLAARLSHRVQISSDALKAYQGAIERAFGAEVDYGSIIKTFSHTELVEQRRYSPPEVIKVERAIVQGMSERIEQLRLAVETMYRCKASHEASTPILETFRGQKVWEGVVESFALAGHPKAKRCYAWSYQDKGEPQYVTALEIPPVESPITAVRASIVADAKGRK